MAGLTPAPLAECGAPDTGRAYWVTAADGVQIRLAHWPGARHVLILPGRTEYIEKYGELVRDLGAAGWGALVVDWRGQGLADRALSDPLCGHVSDFAEFQRDLDAVLAVAKTLAPGPLPWIAHSMGGCIALRGLMRGKTPAAVAFSAPMLGLPLPPVQAALLRLVTPLARLVGADGGYAPTTGPTYGLTSMGFGENNLTTDRAQFDRMKAQVLGDARLSLGGPSLRWMGAALKEIAALAPLPAPAVPALFGLGSDDTIVAHPAIRARVTGWPDAALIDYPGARHELLMERPEVRDDFLARILTLFARHGG
ncbi:alpha/beta fold hydrolase [Pararhodobacter zhoushanensis]|uniref:Alpha/beta hydrolase n=1 Tax=Pararhodobacter zhoushanensis TaxID=2479545 RepID=A0ABT3H2K6_9RHOB|nr:alpha/beta hydrolase [Pararhodobacter zhoushanensis]MCW1934043.1 alpha/beta hydrolase [Pararhodobacter zhoushanensis]